MYETELWIEVATTVHVGLKDCGERPASKWADKFTEKLSERQSSVENKRWPLPIVLQYRANLTQPVRPMQGKPYFNISPCTNDIVNILDLFCMFYKCC